jgi:hypothetical protein
MKRIIAEFDDHGVYVYQAFKTKTVQAAVRAGRFQVGFNRNRMTWIKPSFAWMLHRSDYATKKRQEAIARVKISHEGFLAILSQSIPTQYNPQRFDRESTWRRKLDLTDVRHQWDPDRDSLRNFNGQRAIQIGLSGAAVHSYVDHWILSIEDVTPLAREIVYAICQRTVLPQTPDKRPYPVDDKLALILGMSEQLENTRNYKTAWNNRVVSVPNPVAS